ncbi:metalloregulator ArsR/SmtB family transcription factor [Rhizobium sp. TRM95111]|uniref:ArsR/SmtB family transcription factor n=1 Tax=Rhizobium alarense TaxID=2846851 RepID=UPI001F22ECF8|nr:metalloregulator ArsR/SmtB family transcription factor [Rhizobium alarense]MCF3642817.1 metalloregulator ArsR/SmtB family transcription factor [Rhizobium alarense]
MEQENAILALAALAQSTRLETFRLLVEQEPEGMAAGDIARTLAVPQNTMSAHLNVLSRAGLVTSERRSRLIVYRADVARLRDLTLFLVKDCCGGDASLCAPLIAELTPCCPPLKVSP